MSPRTVPQPWRDFLGELDATASGEIVFHCLGGFVITAMYGLARPTADIDVLSITPAEEREPLIELAGKGSALHRKYRVYLDYVTVATQPGNYDERLVEMFAGAFRRLRLLALDPYDLALAKLERNLQRDRDDVKYLAQTLPFDLQLLRDRYTRELRPYLGNPEREDLTVKLWIEAIEEERSRP